MINVNIISVLLISVLVCMLNTQEDSGEEIFDHIIAHKVKTLQEIEFLQNTTDMTYFIYCFKKSSKTSRQIAPLLLNMAKKLEYIAEFILLDCDEVNFINQKVCEHKNLTLDQFPRMKVLVPPEFRINPYTKKLNGYTEVPIEGKQISNQILFNFITKYVHSHAMKLSSSNIDNFLK